MAEDAIGRRYSMLKKRAEQGGTARRQRETDALRRAEAQSGMQGSGAFMKQRQLAGEAREADISRTKEALDVGESGERFQQEQIKAQRDFARSEREAGQSFAAEQAGLGREFARSERLGGQKFASMEASKQRGFSKNLFDREMKFKDKQFKEGARQFMAQMREQRKMNRFNKKEANRRFEMDQMISNFNMDMANKQFNKKTLTDSLLGFDSNTGEFTPMLGFNQGSPGSQGFGGLSGFAGGGGGGGGGLFGGGSSGGGGGLF